VKLPHGEGSHRAEIGERSISTSAVASAEDAERPLLHAAEALAAPIWRRMIAQSSSSSCHDAGVPFDDPLCTGG
jgi:hypothetical protein